ncbi:MAG: hypothetical protein IMY67_07495 [Bacteroidetes bacterium]|nr:hypothetical protein [Bacteroidota bacterium]
MKHILLILAISFTLGCKAQNIYPIYEGPEDPPNNPYYKDVDNDFNPFIGEWKWEEGNNSLILQFQKVEMYHKQYPNYNNSETIHEYFDYLIGEYKYIENSNVLVNTLPVNFSGNPTTTNAISGWNITTVDRGFPPCDECTPNTRFIFLSFGELENPQLQGMIRMAHFIENGVEKIRARITNTYISNLTADYTGPDAIKVPEGIYTFIKQ